MSDHRQAATLGYAILAAFMAATNLSYAQNPAQNISIDDKYNRAAINPNIYGAAYASTANLKDLNIQLDRQGGNNTSRYNWLANADNRAADYFFESIAYSSPVAGEVSDTFVANAKAGNAQAMLTIPMVGYVAKLDSNRNKLWSFGIGKYGPQTASDPFNPDAGNGISSAPGNPKITGNDPLDADIAADSTFQTGWINHLVSTWGPASSGGLKYYILDNEHSIWQNTHRDIHPIGATMDEILQKMLDYGGKVKTADPSALVMGPDEYGWTGYLYSGFDQQYAATHGWSNLPDRAAHGGQDYMPWLLGKLRQSNLATGKKTIDIFALHYYPQGGEFSNDTSDAMKLRRNRSTRSLWDPSYVDESWINTQVKLIPRMKGWVASNYPGLQVGLTEYNWGAEGDMNGATAQADILGILGREGADMATRWTTPNTGTPTYNAIKIFRNYDGNKAAFGDTTIQDNVDNPDNLASFASERSSDGAMTVMVINKYLTGNTPVSIDMKHFHGEDSAQRWQLTAAGISELSDVSVNQGGKDINDSVPAQSITLYVVPPHKSFVTTGYASASPTTVAAGTNAAITATIEQTGSPLNSGTVEIDVLNPSGTRVGQKIFTAQSFTTGVTNSYAYTWTAAATPGVYTVTLKVSNGSSVVYTNNNAASIIVPSPDASQYNFELDSQGWVFNNSAITSVNQSSDRAFIGTHSLAVNLDGNAGGFGYAYVNTPAAPSGALVTFHVWIPIGSSVNAIQPYMQQGPPGGYAFTGNYQSIGNLTPGAWNTVTVQVPANAAQPLFQCGVQFFLNPGWAGTCYIDSITW